MASKKVSFSQFSTYLQCPHKWRLEYIDGHRRYTPSIHTVYGTAIHNTIQNYLTEAFEVSVKVADQIDLGMMLKNEMVTEYASNKEKLGDHFSNPKELEDFYYDGLQCVNYVKKNRSSLFPTKNHKLVGIELPLNTEIRKGIRFIGFLDIVMYNKKTGQYKIIDLKTSTRGWKYEKKDPKKTAQLILYKKYYAEKLEVDPTRVDIEFVILRRKINEEAQFVPKRIQSFVPSHGRVTMNKVTKLFESFLDAAFTEDGEYNKNGHFPTQESKLCDYCPFNKTELCTVGKKMKDEAKRSLETS